MIALIVILILFVVLLYDGIWRLLLCIAWMPAIAGACLAGCLSCLRLVTRTSRAKLSGNSSGDRADAAIGVDGLGRRAVPMKPRKPKKRNPFGWPLFIDVSRCLLNTLGYRACANLRTIRHTGAPRSPIPARLFYW